jgi:ribose-phosphate pyrophosphokinase
MKILNLTPGFEPFGPSDFTIIKDDTFYGGEINLRIANNPDATQSVLITVRANSSDDLMRLFMATSIVKSMGIEHIEVFLPYLPYGRQDRACRVGEAFSLRAFARLINAQGYGRVYSFEAHSEVATELIDNFCSISIQRLVEYVLGSRKDAWIVYPDKGAQKRYEGLAMNYGEQCLCEKRRDDTGAIAGVTVPVEDFGGKDIFIIDDIIDGGRTFIEIAKVLKQKNVGSVNLIAAHGLFSYGEQPLKDGGIDHVFVSDSFKVIDSPYVTQVKLCDILTLTTTRA